MSFDVGADGVPMNFHVKNSSNPAMEKIIIAALRDWHFHPAMNHRAPIAVPAEFEFVHHTR
jgi:hypothetical protein